MGEPKTTVYRFDDKRKRKRTQYTSAIYLNMLTYYAIHTNSSLYSSLFIFFFPSISKTQRKSNSLSFII